MSQPSDENERRDPVEVIRHAREYVVKTRGASRAHGSMALEILDTAERQSAKCIDYLLGDKLRTKGVACPCDFHQEEALKGRDTGFRPRDGENSAKPASVRNGKMAAAGEDE